MRPRKWMPEYDIKGIRTLREEGKTAQEIADYFKSHGINVARRTVSQRLEELFP